ncbi:RING finger domain-containing protein [Coniochaeta hoffmannii]|uniref:RING finger domain-containing protein n=1 Tax=Coniochaeta hoffmannii TaxID=91930 RepID=A0AA38RDJ5_9PEZI|nr:RING finger domain-containing protein [Coniochaeta hoffmannii]
MSQSEVDREIEDFARQIQEEGLLEGLDLDNLDLSNNDELSRKITEAYRRRQRQRSRHDGSRRSNASAHSHHSDPDNRSRLRVASRQGRSRSSSQTGQGEDRSRQHAEDRSRPPTSSGSAHLVVQQPRPRRRTASGGRSATVPVGISQPEQRVAARSQTDLSLRTNHTSEVLPGRPSMTNEGRSTSTPTMTTAAAGTVSNSATTQSIPFSARAASSGLGIQHPPQPSSTTQPPSSVQTSSPQATPTSATRPRPSDILVSPSFSSHPDPLSPSHSPLLPPTHTRTRSQLYPEPSITCKRCQRPHIEYTLHYNCSTCHSGTYNLCLDCYRRGKGCLHWFGFGYGAWRAYQKALAQNPPEKGATAIIPRPHMLTANRYRRPKILPGGAEGRVTMSNQNPELRLESGTFCARCERWTTGEVYWRCEGCNEGDWGFCSECVDTGRACSHALLPLTYVPPPPPPPPAAAAEREGGGEGSSAGPSTPRVLLGGRVALQSGDEGAAIGPFKPVVVAARCEVCGRDVQPREERLHCYACPSGPGGDSRAGEWEVCAPCYARLEGEGRISPENGMKGWRRCLAGHRMAVIAYVEGKDGVLRRMTVRDWVGGRTLGFEEYALGLQVCYWIDNGVRKERLVTRDVAATAETDVGVRTRWTDEFPPDGGSGGRAVARWAWYPAEGAEDELLFPKGAEVREIEDVNGEWFHGVYMGAKGLFPAPYVVPLVTEGN